MRLHACSARATMLLQLSRNKTGNFPGGAAATGTPRVNFPDFRGCQCFPSLLDLGTFPRTGQKVHNKMPTHIQQASTMCTTRAYQLFNKCSTTIQQVSSKCPASAQYVSKKCQPRGKQVFGKFSISVNQSSHIKIQYQQSV